MALVFKDRVKETSTTTGTGTYTLAGAVTGFVAFSVIGNANTCYYCATDGTDWEVGLGTYTLSGTTLARTTVLASSNAGAAVNWGAGTRTIFNDLSAAFWGTTGALPVGTIELGAASDTTLARSSAGNISIEGNVVYRAGGTDVPVADGGTGASTLAANNVLLGNGTSAVQVVAPSTSGNVLTSNGTTWQSTAPQTVDLLGTVASTSGTSISFTSLSLTGYKMLRIVLAGVSASNTRSLSFNAATVASLVATSSAYGMIDIDLGTGAFASNIAVTDGGVGVTVGGSSGLTTSSTSVTLTLSGNNFDAGSVKLYGIP